MYNSLPTPPSHLLSPASPPNSASSPILTKTCAIDKSSGKAARLEWLRARLGEQIVPPGVAFSQSDWDTDAQHCLAQVHDLGPGPFAVRSNAGDEDQSTGTLAGRYLTELNVEQANLGPAISRVFGSQREATQPGVLVQSMISEFRWVVVASTHRIADGAPWYCIDLGRGDSALITAGRANGRQLAFDRAAVRDKHLNRPWFDAAGIDAELMPVCRSILTAMMEIERQWQEPFECELLVQQHPEQRDAVKLFVLQARPIGREADRMQPPAPAAMQRASFPDFAQADEIDQVSGTRRVLSMMADWNPAELLGAHPRPLALSLFRHAIADGVWWEARDLLGYAPAPSASIQLLEVIAGRPFVDVRRSTNSLLPRGLAPSTSKRLVDAWLNRLISRPELHDKFEFEVCLTAAELEPSRGLQVADDAELTTKQRDVWLSALLQLTRSAAQRRVISTHKHRLATELSRLGQQQTLDECLGALRRCGRHFAALARLAFIAEAQLRSAQRAQCIEAERAAALRQYAGGMQRVLQEMEDSQRLRMRPGSFEICHPRWTSSPPPSAASSLPPDRTPFKLSTDESRALSCALRTSGLADGASSADDWVAFALDAMRSREWAKWVFNQCLGLTLSQIERLGMQAQLCPDTLSFLNVSDVRTLEIWTHSSRNHRIPARLAQRSIAAEQRYRADQDEILSPVLAHAGQRYVADSLASLPNFVGSVRAHGEVICLDRLGPAGAKLNHKIVAIRAADPGYDWIFQHPIQALITAWGGANSHMAIRCSEFGLPAAIGCGEVTFDRLSSGCTATLDPLAQQLIVGPA